MRNRLTPTENLRSLCMKTPHHGSENANTHGKGVGAPCGSSKTTARCPGMCAHEAIRLALVQLRIAPSRPLPATLGSAVTNCASLHSPCPRAAAQPAHNMVHEHHAPHFPPHHHTPLPFLENK